MRQLLDEADRIGDEHARPRLGLQRADRGIEGGEQLVLDQHFARRERPHQRRFPRIGVAHQRDPELVAARRPALVVVALDRLQLSLQLREPIADLAAIEFEIGLARADALLPSATRGFAQARRDVFQPRDLDLQLRLAAVRMAMEDLHDHPGAVEHLRAGCALEIAGLARRNIVVDDHELRPCLRIRFAPPGVRLLLVGVLKALAGLRLALYRHRSDHAGPAGHRGEFLKPPLAEHRRAADLVALLRQRADDVVTQRLHQAGEFFQARGVFDIVDIGGLDADENRARNWRSGFHDTALAGSF